MTEYEALRQRHVALAVTFAPRLIDQLEWPADRLAARRTRLLRELVRTATERSPWYRKRLAHVDIDRLDESALPELPVQAARQDYHASYLRSSSPPGAFEPVPSRAREPVLVW
jgi:phenylacetate-coenzyme A ligase PaaK-like adenylate-forming protein